MRVRLDQIATIFTGATLKEKPEHAEQPDSYLMQLGDLDANGGLNSSAMLPFIGLQPYFKFIAKPGDLVFRGRGAGINAVAITETDIPIIVSSPLMILRPDHKKVNSAYLKWAITSIKAYRHYAQYMSGSVIMGVGKQDLDMLEIDLPDLSTQQKISKIKKLQTQEAELLTHYKNIRAKLFDALISNTTSIGKVA